ncbi:unnamed protein product [Clonostachys chloroleuca]|uniref:Thioesterase domain-containing protein n=1 Tax=Clonostachys chloroleuca TaxID=1926264 RepID=A0AA35M0W4_9HYPO|nr:unnamed protein product [Clonostachys chloroleuca]
MSASPDVNHFLSIPWCASVIGDIDKLDYIYPQDENPDIDLFHRRLLRVENGMSAFMIFAKRAPQPTDGSDLGIFAIREMTLLVDVGVNVSGWEGVCHGGFTSFLFDIAGGWLGQANVMQAIADGKILPTSGSMTKKLEVEYLAPVLVPRVLMLKSEINKIEGRDIDIGITLEDERGKILSRGRLASIITQPKKARI